MNIHFVLKYTNNFNEVTFFVSKGPIHMSPKLGPIRLISAVTPDKKKALKFETATHAAAMLAEAGNPADWTILTVEEKP